MLPLIVLPPYGSCQLLLEATRALKHQRGSDTIGSSQTYDGRGPRAIEGISHLQKTQEEGMEGFCNIPLALRDDLWLIAILVRPSAAHLRQLYARELRMCRVRQRHDHRTSRPAGQGNLSTATTKGCRSALEPCSLPHVSSRRASQGS